MDKEKKFDVIFYVVIVIVAILAFNIINYVKFDAQRQGKNFDVYLTNSGLRVFSVDTNSNTPISIELYSDSFFELRKNYYTDEKPIQSNRILNIWTIKTDIEPRTEWIVEGITKIQAIFISQEKIKLVFSDEIIGILINPINVLTFTVLAIALLIWIIIKKEKKLHIKNE